jgi:hypothetical protein
MKVAIVIALAVCFLGAIAAFVILTSTGKDTTGFVLFISGAAATLVPNLFTLLKTHQAQADIAEIKEQTNGPLTQMQTQVDEIATHIKEGNPNA